MRIVAIIVSYHAREVFQQKLKEQKLSMIFIYLHVLYYKNKCLHIEYRNYRKFNDYVCRNHKFLPNLAYYSCFRTFTFPILLISLHS